jgi:enamine deaminase RidA (YjgF/YER057c/UK114 family)
MASQLMDVPGLSEPPGYAHVAIGQGSGFVFTAGQVPLDSSGNLVGEGDHEAQTRQVLQNLLATLEAAGASPDDVLKTTVYVVGNSGEAQVKVWEVVRRSPVGRAASTLLGVELLGYTGQLVEIEAVAVRD